MLPKIQSRLNPRVGREKRGSQAGFSPRAETAHNIGVFVWANEYHVLPRDHLYLSHTPKRMSRNLFRAEGISEGTPASNSFLRSTKNLFILDLEISASKI